MNEMPGATFPDALQELYTRLNPQDVEQFYAGYQLWHTRQQIAAIQVQVTEIQQRIAENIALMQQTHPSPIALATLVRLQVSGVNDVFLLERMLERGEIWLDNTMQHLDYCERFDFINGDYTQWCENALEGAYDWIDSMRDAIASTPATPAEAEAGAPVDADASSATDAIEELFLQKLAHEAEAEEDLAVDLEITQKIPRISLPAQPRSELSDPSAPSDRSVTLAEPVDAVEADDTSLSAEPLNVPVFSEPDPGAILEPTNISEVGEPEPIDVAESAPVTRDTMPTAIEITDSSSDTLLDDTANPVDAPETVPVEVTVDAIDFSIPTSVLEEDVPLITTPAEASPVVAQDNTVVEDELPATEAEIALPTWEAPAHVDTQITVEQDEEVLAPPDVQIASELVEETASEQEPDPVEADLPAIQAEVSEPAEEPASIERATEDASLVESEPTRDTEEDIPATPTMLMPASETALTTEVPEESSPSLETPPLVQEEAVEPDASAVEIPIPVADLPTMASPEPQQELPTQEGGPEADSTQTEEVTISGAPGVVAFTPITDKASTAEPLSLEDVEPKQVATTEVLEQAPAVMPEPSNEQEATAIENTDTAIETPVYNWQPQAPPPVETVPKPRHNFLQRLLAKIFGR